MTSQGDPEQKYGGKRRYSARISSPFWGMEAGR
jgi:hypothetical protein